AADTELPEGPGTSSLQAVLDGAAVFKASAGGKDTLWAADAETGDVLWERPEDASFVAADPGGSLLYVQEGEEYRAVDAGSGEVVEEDVSGETSLLIDGFGARHAEPRRGDSESDLLGSVPRAYGPGVEEFGV